MRPHTGELQALVLEPDHYSRLGVPPEALDKEISKRFTEASQGLHLNSLSDGLRFDAAERLLVLTQSYELLSNPIERSHYDIRRFGREDLPLHPDVQEQFKAGLAAYRKHKLELALAHFKKAVEYYPHRPLFRIHLANIYYEKKWYSNVENELETALKLDPEDRFAKETIARLIFAYEHFEKERKTPFMRRFRTQMLTRLKTGNLTQPLDEIEQKQKKKS